MITYARPFLTSFYEPNGDAVTVLGKPLPTYEPVLRYQPPEGGAAPVVVTGLEPVAKAAEPGGCTSCKAAAAAAPAGAPPSFSVTSPTPAAPTPTGVPAPAGSPVLISATSHTTLYVVGGLFLVLLAYAAHLRGRL